MAKSSDQPKKTLDHFSPLVLLQNVARQARTNAARHLAQSGLHAGQETIIALLAENDTMTPGELAKALGVRAPTVTRSIARLKEQGFVASTVDQTDRRQVRVQLTESGNNILKKAHKAARKAEKQALRDLDITEVAQLQTLLTQMAATLEKRDQKIQRKAAKISK